MAFHTTNGKAGGFTLIELLVVMAIIATLMTLVMPQYFRQHTKAQETVLRHNLVSIRQALDHYREDKGNNPETLEDPRDPITGRRDTWQLQRSEDSGFGDVHSGAPGRAVDGSDYGSW